MIDNWYHHGSNPFLHPSPSPSSSRSSHLSILTTSSSISSTALSDQQQLSPLQPSASGSGSASGSKTHAFFGSPFSDTLDLHPPPPPPIVRSDSQQSNTSVTQSTTTSEHGDPDTTPRLPSSPSPPSTSRSLNDSFFSTSVTASQPTPPPSIRPSLSSSASTSTFPSTSTTHADRDLSNTTTPPTSPPTRLAPLSRLFPSRVRYTGVDALPSREGSVHGHGLAYAHSPPFGGVGGGGGRRGFVELDPEEYREPERSGERERGYESGGYESGGSGKAYVRDAERGHDSTSTSTSSAHHREGEGEGGGESTNLIRARGPPLPSVPKHKQLSVHIVPDTPASSLPTPIASISASSVPAAMTPAPAPKAGDVIEEPLPPPPSSPTSQNSPSPTKTTETAVPRLRLHLIRTLGVGAFSSVWLARDVSSGSGIGALEVVRKTSLRRSRSLMMQMRRRGHERSVSGGSNLADGENEKEGRGLSRAGSSGSLRRRGGRSTRKVSAPIVGASPSTTTVSSPSGLVFREGHQRESSGSGSDISFASSHDNEKDGGKERKEKEKEKEGRLVALKMTDRALCDRDDRTRVSFVREVEVLKHISHPSIVAYIHAFSTPSHHLLVLEHIPGGELFDLVASPETHARLTEPVLRRVFGELCRAVGWMHGVGLVHRDIKLENILLTRSPFSPPSPQPLIKLTDFGLSRFIDPAAPYLTTRCGSESYAAPELVTGRPYDGRETDAWACGVVLFALVARRLPFDAWDPCAQESSETQGQGEQGVRHEEQRFGGKDARRHPNGPRRDERTERRALLVRIAKGEYTWPSPPPPHISDESEELRGARLAASSGARRVVERLLVRDPKKRARIAQLWEEEEWMRGDGAPPVPSFEPSAGSGPGAQVTAAAGDDEELGVRAWEADVDADVEDFGDDDEDEDMGFADEDAELEGEGEEGVLVDEEDIGPGSVARQEH